MNHHCRYCGQRITHKYNLGWTTIADAEINVWGCVNRNPVTFVTWSTYKDHEPFEPLEELAFQAAKQKGKS